MLSEDYEYIVCDEEGCENKIKNHKWGKIKAEGWVFTERWNKPREDWCPEHIPAWWAEWKRKRDD
jgi:hypothetical protein